jgi:hypothetical protein
MADHISGPRALAEPIADITDVYAFPSPQRPGRLVLVMNTLPFAQPADRFSDGLIYRFRLRRLAVRRGSGPGLFDIAEAEVTVDCVFDEPEPDDRHIQYGVCRTSEGVSQSFQAGERSGGSTDPLRVFAGVRWDPFFMDAPAALKTIATGQLSFGRPGTIFLDGKNVLSIVVELDVQTLLGVDVALVGVVAETLTRGRLNVRIERVGRPEVKNLMLAPKQFDQVNRDLEIRDLYNMEDAFHLAEGYQGAYRARLDANLVFWDGLDGKADWPVAESGAHALRGVVLDDFLVVDVGKPYAEHGTFFEIERALLNGEAHRSCGGRALNDDAMDTLFTVLVNAGTGPVISDGVDAATMPASASFPYLAAPNPDPPRPPAHV